MKLSKDFLHHALPSATFIYDNAPLTDASWHACEDKGEVGVSFDSRTLHESELFVPLKGTATDGHAFIEIALANGACGSLVAREQQAILQLLPEAVKTHKLFIIVPNVQDALIALACAWRQRFTCPVVGITGSLGKTTTKEMVRSIVQAAGMQAYVSFKNYNNVLGVCYNILRTPSSVQAMVLEMGINECGEMRQLAAIVRPTLGVITRVAHVHTEGLGNSLASVAQEKREIFSFFTSQNIGIVCGDQPLLTRGYYVHPVARFGLRTKNQVYARGVQISCDEQGLFTTRMQLSWYRQTAWLNVPGNNPGLVYNALAASTVAYFLAIPFDAVIQGLTSYKGAESRFEIKKIKDSKGIMLNDCYNASPESMEAALHAFSQFKLQGSKIAVLGDMLELGTREAFWHRHVGKFITREVRDITRLILVGDRARMIGAMVPLHMPVDYVPDWQAATVKVQELLADTQSSVILVKASHGMHLDRLVQVLAD